MTIINGVNRTLIDLDALAANYHAIQKFVSPSSVMPVLKANAYGHGLVRCAQRLEREGAKIVAVAFLEEAMALRAAGLKLSILVLGGLSGRQIRDFILNDIDMSASSVSKLAAIDAEAKQLGKQAVVHLKIDTGMGRIGQSYKTAEKLLVASKAAAHCKIGSIFSHFACAENRSSEFNDVQLNRLQKVLDDFYEDKSDQPPIHFANSGAILNFRQSHLDMVRPGLILFGVYPDGFGPADLELKPVLSLYSEVVYFKAVPAGTGISYDLTWTADEPTRIVTIPIGYGDGLSRKLSNKGRVLIHGKSFPIVGKVCMDQLMVNLGPQGEAYNGDEVAIVGGQGNTRIDVAEMAKICEEDPRDLLLRFALRIPRTYVEADQ